MMVRNGKPFARKWRKQTQEARKEEKGRRRRSRRRNRSKNGKWRSRAHTGRRMLIVKADGITEQQVCVVQTC